MTITRYSFRNTISRETSHEVNQEDDERPYHVWERRFGSFQRSFTLPRTVRPEDIEAEYRDGILCSSGACYQCDIPVNGW